MRNKKLWMGIGIGVVMGLLLATAGLVVAGNLNPPAGPTEPESQMYTLEQIHTRLTGGGDATKMTSFTEPSSGPGSTMVTLDDIYALALPARVPRTGQTTSYAIGDDGDLEMGVAWPDPRFITSTTGIVTDTLTGLVWLQNANCFGAQTWANALGSANGLASGSCGLTDGSVAGDWRLPNVRELGSLIDYRNRDPALPSDHPFIGAQSNYYWTSTTLGLVSDTAWHIRFFGGATGAAAKETWEYYVWPVRGGQ